MLPSELADKLPGGLDAEKVSAYVTVHSGITSSSGETHLLVHDGEMVAVTRVSSVYPFDRVDLDQSALPRLASRFGSQRLFLKTKDGIEHWLAMADIDRKEALPSLEELYESCGAWDALADTIKVQIELSTDNDAKIVQRLRLARLLALKLGQGEEAVGIYRDVLIYRPDNGEVIDGLMEIHASGVARKACHDMLERACESAGRWDDLMNVHQITLEDIDDPYIRRRHLDAIIEICAEHIGDPERAMVVCGEIFEDSPSDLEVRERLMGLAEKSGGWAKAADILESAADKARMATVKAELMGIAAKLHADRLGQSDRAEALWRAVLEIDPHHRETIVALRQLQISQRRWSEVVSLYEAEIELVESDPEKIDLLMALGALFEDRLQDPQSAIAAFERVHDADPAHDGAHFALNRLFTGVEDWARLQELLAERVNHVSGSHEIIALKLAQATLAHDALADIDAAIVLWQGVLDIDADHAGALVSLEQAFTEGGRWLDLSEVLDRKKDTATDTAERVELCSRLGTLWGTHLHNDAKAMTYWREVLDLEPNNTHALSTVCDLAEKAGDQHMLVTTLKNFIPLLPEGDRAEPQRRLARTLGSLDRAEEAVEAWQAVLVLAPGDKEAVAAVEPLYKDTQRWDELAGIWLDRAAASTSKAEQQTIWIRLAHLYGDTISNDEKSIEAWRQVLALDQDHKEATETMESLLEAHHLWDTLVDHLEARLKRIEDTSERVAMARRIADLTQGELKDLGRTFEVLHGELHDNWRDDDLIGDVAMLTAKTGQWRRLADTWIGVLGESRDDDAQSMIRERMEDGLRVSMTGSKSITVEIALHVAKGLQALETQDEYALTWYRKVLAAKPSHAEAKGAVHRLCERIGLWDELVAQMEREAARIDKPEDRVTAYREIAAIYRDRLGDEGKAKAATEKADDADSDSFKLLVFMMVALAVLAVVVFVFTQVMPQ